MTPNNFVNGSRCKFCCNHHGAVHKFDSIGYLYPQVLNVWSDKNNKSVFNISPCSEKYAWFKCENGNEIYY
jgi:hypothetical protein